MTRFASTYNRDYVDPKKMFLIDTVVDNSGCPCPVTNLMDPAPSAKKAQPNDVKPTCEWTGIAPMGMLIKPNVIPPTQACAPAPNAQSNGLPCPPKLSASPVCAPPAAATCERMSSTYAADFRNPQQPASDVCEPLAADFRSRFERGCYVPIWRPQVCTKHCPVKRRSEDSGPPDKKPVSEYMGITSHTGGIIMRYKLNDHKKCKPWKCEHIIPYKMLPRSGR